MKSLLNSLNGAKLIKLNFEFVLIKFDTNSISFNYGQIHSEHEMSQKITNDELARPNQNSSRNIIATCCLESIGNNHKFIDSNNGIRKITTREKHPLYLQADNREENTSKDKSKTMCFKKLSSDNNTHA